jgi:hypothetical protein
MPPPPGPTTPVSFLAIADLGQAEPDGSLINEGFHPSLATAARLAGEVGRGAGLLVHLGDISYARGYSTQVGSVVGGGKLVRSADYGLGREG